MCIKFTKGPMQGPLGDIGRHRDFITNICTNIIEVHSPRETPTKNSDKNLLGPKNSR